MKNDIVANLRLELERERTRVRTSVRCGDTKTITYHFTLLQSGKIYDLSNALMANIWITKPDGKVCYNSCVIDGNEIYYTLKTQDINVTGEDKCYLEVVFDDSASITTPEFIVYVYENGKYETSVISQNEYSALSDQIVKANEYAKSAQESEQRASDAAEKTEKNAEEVSELHTNITEMRDIVLEYVERAQLSAETAETLKEETEKVSTDAADASREAKEAAQFSNERAESALESAANAGMCEQNALAYKDAAGLSEQNATAAKASCEESKEKAEKSEQNAKESEKQSEEYEATCKKLYEILANGGANLVLGETHLSAFFGDWGKEAYEHANTKGGNPHAVTYEETGAEKSGTAQTYYENAVAYVDKAIADLINGAPDTLDTLKEIADAMQQNDTVVQALSQAIGTKANASEVDTHMNNEVIHVTETERKKWDAYNARISQLEKMIDAMGYPVSMSYFEN